MARAQELWAPPTQPCRDAWGEPTPCEVVVAAPLPPATVVGPVAAPAMASQGELTATITSLLVLRADIGLGLEAHVGMFGFYATARAGIAGYFADAAVSHATLGDLGRIPLAEDALELGWELAVSVELEEGLSFQLAAEGMHLGAETLGASARVVGTF